MRRSNPAALWSSSSGLGGQRLFRLFRFYTKTGSSVFQLNQNKQKSNRNSLIESIFWYFFKRKFWFVSVGLIHFVLVVSLLYQNIEFRCFDSTKTFKRPTKQFDREQILVFFRKFMVVSVCFETILFDSVVSISIGLKHRNKPKQTKIFCFWVS